MRRKMMGGYLQGCVGISLALAACQPGATGQACQLPGQIHMTELKLYFGRDIPGGGFVDNTSWKDFMMRVLTPAFPEGFTVYEGFGQWRNPTDGSIKSERSFVVERLGKLDGQVVDHVVMAYRARFKQNAVGLVTTERCAVF